MSSSRKKISTVRKYRTLIVSLVIFLILTTAILLLNMWTTHKLTGDAAAMNAAGRQNALIQQISARVMAMNLSLAEEQKKKRVVGGNGEVEYPRHFTKSELPAAFDSHKGELDKEIQQVDAIVNAFSKGGMADPGDGKPVKISALSTSSKEGGILRELVPLYKNFKSYYEHFNGEYESNKVEVKSVNDMANFIRDNNSDLVAKNAQLVSALQDKSKSFATTWELVQLGFIIAGVILFLFIILSVIKQLTKTDKQLQDAKRETDQIMSTVQEGLFLVDRQLNIGTQYSKELENILGQRKIGGRPLSSVLETMISQENMEVTKIFIDQLYSDYVIEELITDLNPLHKIKVEVDDFAGYYVTKYLDFKFSRVYQGQDIDKVLVSVTDISEAVMLEERLNQEREQNDRQIEMLSSILDSDQSLLNSFIKGTKARINFINQTLKQPEKSSQAMQEKLKDIYRETHSLKGESSAMKLHSFVGMAENFENRIKELQKNPHLTGNDFLSLTVLLDELVSLTHIFDNLTQRIGMGQTNQPGGQNYDPFVMKKYFERYAQGIAERAGKKLNVNCQGMDDPCLSEKKRDILKDLTIQLVRNAVVHGIETPQERKALNKPQEGNLQIFLSHQGRNLIQLVVVDDGAGLNFEKVRQKAVKMGLYSAQDAQKLDRKQLLALIFTSGFSTAETSNEDAGRGMGMDIIKERINALKGRLQVASQPNQYTRFSVTFPIYD